MDQGSDTLFCRDPCDSRRRLAVHGLEPLRPLLHQYADAVHDRIGAIDDLTDRLFEPRIGEHGFDLADDSVGPNEDGLVRTPAGNPDAPACPGKPPCHVAANESRPTEYGDDPVFWGHGATFAGYCQVKYSGGAVQTSRRWRWPAHRLAVILPSNPSKPVQRDLPLPVDRPPGAALPGRGLRLAPLLGWYCHRTSPGTRTRLGFDVRDRRRFAMDPFPARRPRKDLHRHLHIVNRGSQVPLFVVGSRTSRSQSPMMLMDNVVKNIAHPGTPAIHHAFRR